MLALLIMYQAQGRYTEAESFFLQTMAIQKRVLGEEHQNTHGTITDLGILYYRMGRFEDAAKMLETSLPIKRRVLGLEHPWTRNAMAGLRVTYEKLGRPEDALLLNRELLDLHVAKADKADADAAMLNSAAWTLLTVEPEVLRDPERALGLARRACVSCATQIGPSAPRYLGRNSSRFTVSPGSSEEGAKLSRAHPDAAELVA